jgi:hypothetical protein
MKYAMIINAVIDADFKPVQVKVGAEDVCYAMDCCLSPVHIWGISGHFLFSFRNMVIMC